MKRTLFWIQRGWYRLSRLMVQLFGIFFLRMRVWGQYHVPKTGAAIVCANHVSHFDPAIVGMSVSRPMSYLARATLFRSAKLFGWLMSSLDAFPIDQTGSGLAGMRDTLGRLKRGEVVLIFPEGTRSHDGELQDFPRGFYAIAKRAKVPIVPAGIDGAYESWSRHRTLPRAGRIHLHLGKPLTPEEIANLSRDELFAELKRRIQECQEQAKKSRAIECAQR